jgi:hypothetical protein
MPRLLAAALVLAASAAIVLVAAPDAGAAPAPTVSPATIQPGGSFTVSGSGCWDPGIDPLTAPDVQWVVIVSTAVGNGSVDTTHAAGGAWSVTVQASPAFTGGRGSVEAICRLSNTTSFSYPKVYVNAGFVDPCPPWAPCSPPVPVTPRSTTPAPAPRTSAAPVATRAATPTATPTPTPTAPVVTPVAAPTHASTADCGDCAAIEEGDLLEGGQAVTLSYTGFQPGEAVTLVMHSTPVELGTFTADPAGVVTASFTIPEASESGAHTFTFSGPTTGDHVVRFRLSAAEETPSAAAPETPGTGPLLPVAIGVAALALLGGIVLAVRQRAADGRDEPGNAAPAPDQETVAPIAEPIA